MATYNNGGITTNIPVKLSDYFETSFNVATKKGASAVNINKTQIDMMSADDPSKLDVKVTTDVIVDKLYFEVEALGDKWETNDPKNPTADPIQFVDMIDIVHTNQQQYDNDEKNYYFDISSDAFSEKDKLQTLQLTLDLNDLSHYVEESFRLQVTLYVLSTDGRRISTTLYINVRPQAITSVIPLNYRMTDGAGELDIENTYQSQVIRPGSTNIITIDIAPSIAVYDYIEIIDTTTQDKILLQQVVHGCLDSKWN